VGEKSKMNNSYLLMIILVAAGVSVGFAYAERSVVEVPFDYTGNSCTFDEELVIYTCQWMGSSETIPSDKSDSGIIPPEQVAQESKEAHDLAVADKVEVKLTQTEKLIVKLQEEVDAGTISSADKILLKALEDMNRVCTLGIEHGALIQEYAQFEIPVIDPNTTFKSINYGTNQALGKIIKKTIECKMWDEYRVSHLGQRYLDIEKVGVNNQQHHREMVTDKGTYPSQVLTPEIFKETIDSAKTFICNSSHFDYGYKKQTGCFPTPELIGGGISMADNEAMKKYTAWKSTGNQNRADLLKAEVEKSIQTSLESFAQQHGIDIADLKNLVQNVDEYNEDQKP
jgi:hypothetical protein